MDCLENADLIRIFSGYLPSIYACQGCFIHLICRSEKPELEVEPDFVIMKGQKKRRDSYEMDKNTD